MYDTLKAFDDGIVGLTRRGGNTEGCVCHGLSPYQNVNVTIVAPAAVMPNDTVNCMLKITGGPLIAGGCDIAAGVGNVITSSSDTSLQRLLSSFNDYELTHRYPKFPSGDTVYFSFKYIAPSTGGIIDTIFANGNSVNHDTTPNGDNWNYAANKLITISSPLFVNNNPAAISNYQLYQNYPNPFNPSTKIHFQIPRNGFVNLRVYDITGREVVTLVNAFQTAGVHEYDFTTDNTAVSSGVYFYRLTVYENNSSGKIYSDVKKMILLK
jgi:hypothetical protein